MPTQLLLCDKATDTELADLSNSCQTKTLSPRLSRPWQISIEVPGIDALIRDTSFDGNPNLTAGIRTLKWLQDGVLRAHCTVWQPAPQGDQNTQMTTVTAFDPIQMLQGRYVMDATGNLSRPSFASPISGAEILLEAITNSITFDGPLPIIVDPDVGAFDIDVPPATDLSGYLTNWPLKIGDLYTLLVATNAIDVFLTPVDTHSGADAGIMGVLNVVNHQGDDLSGSVSFDYGLGGFTASNVRRLFDMDILCNKLEYLLGRQRDDEHWDGNVTATEAGLEDQLALELASREIYGTFRDIKVFDDNDLENSVRPLFHQLFKEEVRTRVQPREMLYITPQAGLGYRPFIDFGMGDTVSSNVADFVGPAIAGAQQRLYGFDVTEDGSDGVERTSELICAAADE